MNATVTISKPSLTATRVGAGTWELYSKADYTASVVDWGPFAESYDFKCTLKIVGPEFQLLPDPPPPPPAPPTITSSTYAKLSTSFGLDPGQTLTVTLETLPNPTTSILGDYQAQAYAEDKEQGTDDWFGAGFKASDTVTLPTGGGGGGGGGPGSGGQ